MAGLCTTGVALFHTKAGWSPSASIADDMLAISGLFFLICAYLLFWALLTEPRHGTNRLIRIVEVIFLVALTGMVATGFVMVYTVW